MNKIIEWLKTYFATPQDRYNRETQTLQDRQIAALSFMAGVCIFFILIFGVL